MSEKIRVGEYVRTYSGNIFKIIDGNSDNYDIDIDYIRLENTEERWLESNRYNDNGYFFDEKNIKKHSINIIDLIEVGDYVNGKEVIMDLQKSKDWYKSKDDFITCKDYTFEENEIKSIVTKEQFKEMEYKVNE